MLLACENIDVSKERKKMFFYVFWWFGKTKSFAYVPKRDQNYVVRGKKPSDLLIDFN